MLVSLELGSLWLWRADEVRCSSTVYAVGLQLEHYRRAQQVLAPLTNAASTVPADALSSIRETRVFNILPKTRPYLGSTVFLKQCNGLLLGIGTAVRRDLANGYFAVPGG